MSDAPSLPHSTVSDLRRILGDAADRARVNTVLTRMRQAGWLDAGRQGRSGSAPVTVRQAAIVLLAVAVDMEGDAIAAVEAAETVANFTLRYIDRPTIADRRPVRRAVTPNDLTVLATLAGDIETATARPDYRPPGWHISADRAQQAGSTTLTFCAGRRPLDELRTAHRSTVLSGRLIAQVAALFRQGAESEAA